jgi:DNA-binding CsgD family transcriptional regulator
MLGAMKDAEVAARLGISIHYIRQKRTKLGIKQFRPKRS